MTGNQRKESLYYDAQISLQKYFANDAVLAKTPTPQLNANDARTEQEAFELYSFLMNHDAIRIFMNAAKDPDSVIALGAIVECV